MNKIKQQNKMSLRVITRVSFYYEALLKEFSELPSDCVVIGDRIPMDLLPAHELGFRTVHMRWGRGRMWKSENWIDHSIRELSELLEILV